MSDNHWWALVLLIFLILLGIKVLFWLLAVGFIVWLIKTGFDN